MLKNNFYKIKYAVITILVIGITTQVFLIQKSSASVEKFSKVIQLNNQTEKEVQEMANQISNVTRHHLFPEEELDAQKKEVIEHYTTELSNYLFSEVYYTAEQRKKIHKQQLKLIQDNFTEEEMEYMTEFYQTDLGQSIISKQIELNIKLSNTPITYKSDEIDKIIDTHIEKLLNAE